MNKTFRQKEVIPLEEPKAPTVSGLFLILP